MNKFLKIIKFTSILKYNLIIINYNILKKINHINKSNNKKMKLMYHLMNFLKIYTKIKSVENKYLKLLLIKSKKNIKKINNNLINNSLKI